MLHRVHHADAALCESVIRGTKCTEFEVLSVLQARAQSMQSRHDGPDGFSLPNARRRDFPALSGPREASAEAPRASQLARGFLVSLLNASEARFMLAAAESELVAGLAQHITSRVRRADLPTTRAARDHNRAA